MRNAQRPEQDKSVELAERPTSHSAALLLTALGIVFGDLGTSPLYTFQAIERAIGGPLDELSALGCLSLITWALIVSISIKYCLVVMKADNHGEGGILALVASTRLSWQGKHWPLIACGLFGAALIYGDGVITPAISVLSAVEGLNVATEEFARYVMPASASILLALFAIQRFGTAQIGRAFGPIMLIWFVTIGAIGALNVAHQPGVAAAINPYFAISFLLQHGWVSLVVLGAVFLAITGGEALYADMGHIGRAPIRLAWFALVLPALLLNYAGQTALYLGHADVSHSPFFHLVPTWALYPLVILATLATIIASQAIITGAFSMTRQAMQLGWFPGMRIQQTSSQQYGQIYVPFINWTMMTVTIALTVTFASSDRLAGAYGTAVSTTMLLTTVLLYRIMRTSWRWPIWTTVSIFALFVIIDLAFFAANLLKIGEGGWIPLLLGIVLMITMTTWRAGQDAIHRAQHLRSEPLPQFRREIEACSARSPRTAIFLSRFGQDIPALIVEHVKQFGAVPKIMIALTVRFTEAPRAPVDERVMMEELCPAFWHIVVRYGFMEIPNLPATLDSLKEKDALGLDDAVYFIERDRPVRRNRTPRMRSWRRTVFAFLLRNAVQAVDLFKLPPRRFIEIGREIEI